MLLFCLEIEISIQNLSTSDEASEMRKRISEFVPITLKEAQMKIHSRPIRIYCHGVFDIFHFGHSNCLYQAKNFFPGPTWVIAAVCDDKFCLVKRKPLMSNEERVYSVKHCKYVDEVFPNAPWFPTIELMDEYKIDLVIHDSQPYPFGDINLKDPIEPSLEVGFLNVSPRPDDRSSSPARGGRLTAPTLAPSWDFKGM